MERVVVDTVPDIIIARDKRNGVNGVPISYGQFARVIKYLAAEYLDLCAAY